MAQKTTRAPYNFVPVHDQIIFRYANPSQVPGHDKLDPSLYSGEIQVTVTAETPLYIGDRDRNGFVKDAQGRYVIPGSSLRGLLRQNMKILGMGLIRGGEDFNDYRLVYRDMTSGTETVNRSLRDRYVAVLGIRTVGEKCTVATKVLGGYLQNNGGKYSIVPTVSPVIHLKRKDPVVSRWAERYTFEETVWYRLSGERVTDITTKYQEGYARGVLLSPGVMQNQNRLYLFPAENPKGSRCHLSEEEVLAYQEDVKMKWNGLRGTNREHSMDREFWKMPKPGRKKAVFYAKDENGFTSFGTSQFLRIGYAHPLSDGLPDAHRENRDTAMLDYTKAMLGYVRDNTAYRSRVSVGNLVAVGSPVAMQQMPIMLGSPKPSFSAGYSQEGRDYNDPEFRLNGIKQYWFKSVQPSGQIRNFKVASKMYPLPPRTKFTGVIRYRNLHKDELGLLLWCLRLDEGCCHNMGMGKPYGYGRVRIEIDALREFDIPGLYQDLSAGARQNGATADRVEELIRAYDAYACKQPGIVSCEGSQTLRRRSHIKDFLYIKSAVRSDVAEVSYLALKEHQNIAVPLPTVESVRQEAESKPAATLADLKAKMDAQNRSNSAGSFGGNKKKVKW